MSDAPLETALVETLQQPSPTSPLGTALIVNLGNDSAPVATLWATTLSITSFEIQVEDSTPPQLFGLCPCGYSQMLSICSFPRLAWHTAYSFLQ